MNWTRFSVASAFLAPLAFVILTAIAITNYPGYSIYNNFLSGLGAGKNSAVFFNSAAILAGSFAILLSVGLYKAFGKSFVFISAILASAGLFLIAVGIFPEGNPLHTPVSVAFFAAASLAMIILGAQKRSNGNFSMLMGILIPISFSSGITPFAEHLAVAAIIVWSLGMGIIIKKPL